MLWQYFWLCYEEELDLIMATDVNELDEEKIFVGDENEAEVDEQKDYGEDFDDFNEDRPRKLIIE